MGVISGDINIFGISVQKHDSPKMGGGEIQKKVSYRSKITLGKYIQAYNNNL